MAAITHGMNPEEVDALGRLMKQRATDITNLMAEIDAKLGSTSWEGPDAQRFKGQEWTEHKRALNTVAVALDGAGQSAINNASDQVTASA